VIKGFSQIPGFYMKALNILGAYHDYVSQLMKDCMDLAIFDLISNLFTSKSNICY